jgi:hypothetical protein
VCYARECVVLLRCPPWQVRRCWWSLLVVVVRDGDGSGPVGGRPPCDHDDHGHQLLVGDDDDDVMAVLPLLGGVLAS